MKPVTLLAAPQPAAGWWYGWNSGSPSGAGPTRGSRVSEVSWRVSGFSWSVLKVPHPLAPRGMGGTGRNSPFGQAMSASVPMPLGPEGPAARAARPRRRPSYGAVRRPARRRPPCGPRTARPRRGRRAGLREGSRPPTLALPPGRLLPVCPFVRLLDSLVCPTRSFSFRSAEPFSGGSAMAVPQPVLMPPSRAALFLVVTVHPGAEAAVRDALQDVTGLARSVAFRAPADGLTCVVYARTPAVTERMLRNMFLGDPPGNTDRILDFSRAVTGGLKGA
ncbi:hypothetical protein ACFT54_25265 [Streptomyces cinereoruber]|uniref:hypothetical protein n=2 Tax=Streptomyces cinereoruber TaxID=67260 RepID=UPI00363E9792